MSESDRQAAVELHDALADAGILNMRVVSSDGGDLRMSELIRNLPTFGRYIRSLDEKPENAVETKRIDAGLPDGPPAEVSDVAELFVPQHAKDIVGMEVALLSIALTMGREVGEDPRPTILEGHTGLAKTAVLAYAHHRANWPYRTVAGHSNVDVDSLIGKLTFKNGSMEFQMGILPFCMKHGIAVGIQEINAIPPEVLIMIHEYMDEGRITLHDLGPDDEDFVVEAHPNFRLYGTYNPPEFYPGTRDLSPALKRRCIIVPIRPLDEKKELEAVMRSVPSADEDVTRKIVGTAHEIRRGQASDQGMFFLSTADVVMWAEMLKALPPYEAGIMALMGKVPVEERDNVQKVIRMRFQPDPNYAYVGDIVVKDWLA